MSLKLMDFVKGLRRTKPRILQDKAKSSKEAFKSAIFNAFL